MNPRAALVSVRDLHVVHQRAGFGPVRRVVVDLRHSPHVLHDAPDAEEQPDQTRGENAEDRPSHGRDCTYRTAFSLLRSWSRTASATADGIFSTAAVSRSSVGVILSTSALTT